MKQEIEEIYNNSDYWYIAFCVTPWHLAGVKTFVENMLDGNSNYTNKLGAVVIVPHPRTGYCITEDDVKKINIPTLSDVILCDKDCNRLSIGLFFSNLKKICNYRARVVGNRFILSTLEPYVFCEIFNYNYSIKNKLVLIDEGVSSYLSQLGYIRHSYIESRNRIYEIKLCVRIIFLNIYRCIFKIKVANWLLFDKYHGYKVNEVVSSCYKSQYMSECRISDIDKRYILYLSQPAVTDMEKKIIPELIDNIAKICSQCGVTLYIKVHPRDDMNKFKIMDGVKILSYSGSIEEAYAYLQKKPLFVVGFRSTALLTLKAFYNAECVSVLNLLNTEYQKKENSDEKFFRKAFSKQITFANSYQDIKKIIIKNL